MEEEKNLYTIPLSRTPNPFEGMEKDGGPPASPLPSTTSETGSWIHLEDDFTSTLKRAKRLVGSASGSGSGKGVNNKNVSSNKDKNFKQAILVSGKQMNVNETIELAEKKLKLSALSEVDITPTSTEPASPKSSLTNLSMDERKKLRSISQSDAESSVSINLKLSGNNLSIEKSDSPPDVDDFLDSVSQGGLKTPSPAPPTSIDTGKVHRAFSGSAEPIQSSQPTPTKKASSQQSSVPESDKSSWMNLWSLGISLFSETVSVKAIMPLLCTHVATLILGYYIGFRKGHNQLIYNTNNLPGSANQAVLITAPTASTANGSSQSTNNDPINSIIASSQVAGSFINSTTAGVL